jgi:hypothetical protein
MRAKEFIFEFAPSPLAGALKQAVAAAQQKSPTGQQAGQSPEIAGRNKALTAQGIDPAAYDAKFKALGGTTPNPNQAKTPASTTGATGTADAKNATPGGTQTPQPAPSTSPGQPQQMGQAPAPGQPPAPGQKGPGVLGSFISGMTGGKASSVGGLAGMGAAKTMSGLGLNKTAGAIGSAMSGNDQVPTTQQLQTTLKPGAEVKVPGMDDFKVGKIDNTGIELTGNKFGKIKVDPKTLAGK